MDALVNISRLIQALSLLVRNVKYQKTNCENLAACIKLLEPLVDEAQESNIPLTVLAINSLEALEHALVGAKELLERCGGKASRFYVVSRKQHFMKKFHDTSLKIGNSLRSLPVDIQLSNETHEQVKICLQDLGKGNYCVDIEEEEVAEEVGFCLKDLHDGVKISHDRFTSLAGRLDLGSNQEILREASLLEKEKDHVRIEKDKAEEEFINQLICLVTQMGDDLAEQKQAQDELAGIPIPADFRCPLSLELMSDPVIVASGQTYERVYIQQWLDQGNTTCPKTRQTLSHRNLIPNYTVKALIANWCEANNVALPEPVKLNEFGLHPGPVSSLVSAKSGIDDHRQVQEYVPVSRASTDQAVAPIGSRLLGRSVRTPQSPRVQEDHEVDRRSGSVFETDEENGDASLNLAGADSNGWQRAMVLRDRDQVADNVQSHSRNNSSSSLASSIDDILAMAASNGTTLDGTLVIDDSSPYGSDVSGELERLAISATGSNFCEEHDSLVRAPDWVSVNWRRRSEDRDLNMSRIAPTAAPAALAVDGNDTQTQVERFVEDLGFDSIDVQRNAAAGLRLLAKHNMENRIIIANCGAILPLVRLLHSTDLSTQENAVTALLNLSINDNNKNEIAAAGAIDPLVIVLRSGTPEAKENAAATLFSLSVTDENKVAVGQSGAIQPLVELLMHGTSRGKKDAATALFNLSILHENKARIVRAGAIRPLVELMSDPAAGMVDKAVAVLANLATITEGRMAIGDEGGICALVEVVEMGSQRGKENAAAALLQLCTNSNRFRASVLQEGAIPPLVALSQSGTARAREKASGLLRLFREQRHAVLGRGGPDRHMDHHFDRR